MDGDILKGMRLIKWSLVIFSLFILIIFNIHTASATLNANNIVCSEFGELSFSLSYSCTKEQCSGRKGFDYINITAESGGKSYIIKTNDPPSRITEDEPYDFISKDDILDPNRNYNLVLYDDEEKTEYSVTCPDFKYRCSKINLKIDECMEENLHFYYLFNGLGEQFSDSQLREELDYYINPASKFSIGGVRTGYGKITKSEEIPSSFEVKHTGSDRYLLKILIEDLKNQMLDDILIGVKGCDNKRFNVSSFKNCVEKTCYGDKNCPIGAYCDIENQVCKISICNDCEKISGHECISICKPRNKCEEATCESGGCKYTKKENCCETNSDCNDNLVCTGDTCENNQCIHKEIKCKASDDPCIMGVCEEPGGCKYVRNPKCDKKEETIQEETKEKVVGEQKEDTQPKITNTLKSMLRPLMKGETLSFNFLGEKYLIVNEETGEDYVELQIGDKTEKINLKQTKETDIDGDGKADFLITLKSIDNGKANLEFSGMGSKGRIPLFLIIGVIFIVLSVLGGGFLLIKNKKPKKKEVEEIKEKRIEKPTSKETISVSNFTLKYKQKIILENVSFEIQKGEMVCLLGPSGTGKSTVIEALVGRKTPTKGTLKILGENISKNKKIYDYVGFVPQHAELYTNQTVMQNLLSSATKWSIKDGKNKAEKILSKIGLSNRKDLKASKLSGGQQKLLSLGMELIRDVEVCILDEPTTGLDPNTRNNIITILSQISTQVHKTIFFTTHFMDDAEECDNVIILSDKKIVAEGPPSKLEKMLPGGGKVVNIILDNVTDDLLEKIEKIEGVKKIVREGRNLRILTDEPNAIKLGQKIDEIGGVVNETKIDRATMMEVFVYYTGKEPEK